MRGESILGGMRGQFSAVVELESVVGAAYNIITMEITFETDVSGPPSGIVATVEVLVPFPKTLSKNGTVIVLKEYPPPPSFNNVGTGSVIFKGLLSRGFRTHSLRYFLSANQYLEALGGFAPQG